MLAYGSVYWFGHVAATQGVSALGGFIIPIGLTVFYIFMHLFGYNLIKSGVVCKPIRFFMYYMGALFTIGLPAYWIYMLWR